MSVVRAVLADPTLPGRLALQEVEHPRVAPSEALVRVGAISLNRGEVRRALAAEASWRPGWDLAGVWSGQQKMVQAQSRERASPACCHQEPGRRSSRFPQTVWRNFPLRSR
jgi:hypothetical protein